MQVDVRYFASAREAAGLEHERLDLPEGCSVAELHEVLEHRHPALARQRGGLRFAVAERFAGPTTLLSPGCEVALLPPMSGG